MEPAWFTIKEKSMSLPEVPIAEAVLN
jgi:hypothetical protein